MERIEALQTAPAQMKSIFSEPRVQTAFTREILPAADQTHESGQ